MTVGIAILELGFGVSVQVVALMVMIVRQMHMSGGIVNQEEI